jgi:hypothetical protein
VTGNPHDPLVSPIANFTSKTMFVQHPKPLQQQDNRIEQYE